jgi:hypothetical protein
MPIFYALVARKAAAGPVVLAEFTARSGNFATVTRMVLAKIADKPRMSYVYDECAAARAGALGRTPRYAGMGLLWRAFVFSAEQSRCRAGFRLGWRRPRARRALNSALDRHATKGRRAARAAARS